MAEKKNTRKESYDRMVREIQADARRVNDLFQVSSSQRGALEKSLGLFVKASEEAEDHLKGLSNKMQEVDEQGADEIRRIRVVNASNLRLARSLMANFGRIRDLKSNSLIVS
jgi:hypothetical protein